MNCTCYSTACCQTFKFSNFSFIWYFF